MIEISKSTKKELTNPVYLDILNLAKNTRPDLHGGFYGRKKI